MSRPDRPGISHLRIPDRFYKYLRFFRPPEMLLLVALLLKAWRHGPKQGLVGIEQPITLKEIARNLEMPWSVARRAFNGLQLKGFAWKKGKRLYVQCDLLATALATDFATLLGPSSRAASGPQLRNRGPLAAPGDRRSGPLAAPRDVAGGPRSSLQRPPKTEKVNGVNGFTHGLSDYPTIRARVRKHARNGANAKDPREALSGRSRSVALPPSADRVSISHNGKEGADVSERNGGAPGENDLEARWLEREEMHELMRKIREKVAAGEAERVRNTPTRPLVRTGNVYPVEEEEQREKLRDQARLLLGSQKGESE